MAPPVEIRRLLTSDAADYRAIRLAALRTDPDAFGSVHAMGAQRPMADFVGRVASSVVFGAYAGAHIVGMAALRQEDGPKERHKAFVWGFFVDPDWRRRRVGSALLAALIDEARGIVEQLTLTVVPDNAAAVALYRRFGFQLYGVEPRALRTPTGYADEALMALLLSS